MSQYEKHIEALIFTGLFRDATTESELFPFLSPKRHKWQRAL
jgi:hypothetical protein